MGAAATVDVYSNDKVGGRIAVIEYGGREYEAGASILHKDNQYMAGFANMFGELEGFWVICLVLIVGFVLDLFMYWFESCVCYWC